MADRRDVVIVGGGISGTAAAYELARGGAAVTLVEMGALASMASGWTLAGVRQSGRHPAELPLARAAVRRWQGLAEELGADLEYRQNGNLRLARNAEEITMIATMVEEQRALGLDIDLLPDSPAVRAVAPAIAESVLAASFCPSDGHANPIAAVTAFAAAAARHGAAIRTGTAATAIAQVGGRVTGVETAAGPIAADVVVLAAGVYTDRLCQGVGLSLPLATGHVSVVQTEPLPPLLDQVLGVAGAGFAGRQEVGGRLRVTGGVQPWHGPRDRHDDSLLRPNAAAVSTTLRRGMAVLPALADARIARLWGGLIDTTPDALPVIERAAEIDGLTIAAGFSGHGFCLGPVTGEIIRDLATAGQTAHSIAPFHRARFAELAETDRQATALHG